jgi:hypothetical protein
MCGDYRLRDRDDELFMYYSRLDGAKPFRAILPGGCLPYQNDEILKAAVLPYFRKGANHIHIEDHMGQNAKVPGCAAYLLHNEQSYGNLSPYAWKVEEQDHIRELRDVSGRVSRFADWNGFKVTVNTGLYRHDESGFGSLTFLRTDREIPLPTGGRAEIPSVALRH